MTLCKILTGILLLLCMTATAQTADQDSLLQYYYKYPKQAVQDADILYKQALQEHNNPLLIKSLILKTTFTLQMNQDEYPQLLRELEAYIMKEQNLNIKSILHSYIGQLYSQYYNNNRYQLSQRTDLNNYIPENMEEWSANIFKEKIFSHLLASVKDQRILQQTSVSEYNLILVKGSASDSLRPTLYDFLCHRIIDILPVDHSRTTQVLSKFPSEILEEVSIFAKIPLEVIPLDAPSNILKIWQDLLNFRMQAGHADALLAADLERLEYALGISSVPSKDSIYLATLRKMKKQYFSNPMVIEIMAKEAEIFMYRQPDITPLRMTESPEQEYKKGQEQALAICNEGIGLYPYYNRINLLYNLIDHIKAPEITAEFPQSIYPGEKLAVKINSKNIRTLTISLYQIHMNLIDYQLKKNQKGVIIPKTKTDQHSYSLIADLIRHDTTFQLAVPETGLYEVVIQTEGAGKNLSDHFICTSLFTTSQVIGKSYHFRAYDWQSGKPVKNAGVFLYKHDYPKYTLIDSVYTDAQGRANYSGKQTSGLYYQVVNPENPTGYLQSTYSSLKSAESAIRTELITDRQIYRPGQTVYFKGITWMETTDSVFALDKKQYNIIFRDANSKEIARQKVISNSFGSFTGHFVIPQETLNGNFTLSTDRWSTRIVVADYKRPEFEIAFTESDQPYYTGDTVVIKGKVSSFSGVNSGNTTIHYEIARSSYFFWLADGENKIQGITRTNSDGTFEIKFQTQQPGLTGRGIRPYFYQITATVTDPKGETQKGTTSIPVYSGWARPTIDIPEQINKNQPAIFRISLEDLPARAKARRVDYSISKLMSPSTITPIKDTIIEKMISQGQLLINDKDSIVPSLQDLAPGAYLFTVNCDDVKESRIFYLYSPQDKRPPIPTYSWLVKEKTECLPGETARIQFGTSARNAYVTYEIRSSEKVLKQKSVVLSDEIINIDVLYPANDQSEIQVCITYVKDKKYIQEIIPIRRIRENRTLSIQTKVFRDKLQPGQEEQWEICILGDKGKPAVAEVLAMMYDASLDKLVPYDIVLSPGYLYPSFRYNWNASYTFDSHNFGRLSAWEFKQKNREIPSFRFDQLNLFQNVTMSDFADSEESGMQVYARENSIHPRSMNFAKQTAVTGVANLKTDAGQGNPAVELRQDFQETAFFYPQLRTDSSGNVNLKFKVPESLTKWKFTALATTRDMAVGKSERYITTSKPLMVRPNLPRFLRSGDQTELKVTISNLSDSVQQGVSVMELFIPGSQKIILSRNENFRIPAGESETFRFNFTVPEGMDLAGYRITASGSHFSDGEQHLLPILPDETLVTETMPIYATTAGRHTYSLQNNSTTRKDYRLTLELTTNPIWYAVLALPALTEPTTSNVTELTASYYVNTIAGMIARSNPKITEAIRNWKAASSTADPTLLSKLEQNSELKSILLEASPWALQAQNETERMQMLIGLFDQNRLEYLQKQALEKLAGLQTAEGGWSWFKGMNSSRFMTTNVLTIMARANTIGQQEYDEKEKMMQIKALRYLDNEIRKDFKNRPKQIGYDQTLYLYTRSLYRDIPLGDALEAHKHFMSLAQKQWSVFSLYEKALLSLAMSNYGLTRDAQSILQSLREYAVTTPDQGMYWPANRNEFYRNSAVQVHTALMESFRQIEGNSADLNLMKQWLLRQKQVQSWASVPTTVDAIHALLLTGNDQLARQDQLTVRLGQHELTSSDKNNPLGYIKATFSGGEIRPDMLKAEVTKQTDSPGWGGLFLQYFEKMDQIKGRKTDVSIDKKLFILQTGNDGKQELVAVGQQPLKTGDQVMVRLTLSLNRDMEFLHLKDLRAACFEPMEQLSGNHWKFGTVYYQEVKDAATNFFFNALSRGTYVIEYPVRVNQAGVYQDGIATFQSIYAPEYNSFSQAEEVRSEN